MGQTGLLMQIQCGLIGVCGFLPITKVDISYSNNVGRNRDLMNPDPN